MDNKKRVKIHVCGTDYSLFTDESEEYVQRLGDTLDRAMRNVMGGGSRVSNTMAAVIMAMTYADEAHKSGEAADRLRAQLKEYLDENARLRAETETLRIELTELRRKYSAGYRGGAGNSGARQ